MHKVLCAQITCLPNARGAPIRVRAARLFNRRRGLKLDLCRRRVCCLSGLGLIRPVCHWSGYSLTRMTCRNGHGNSSLYNIKPGIEFKFKLYNYTFLSGQKADAISDLIWAPYMNVWTIRYLLSPVYSNLELNELVLFHKFSIEIGMPSCRQSMPFVISLPCIILCQTYISKMAD